jgi:hypothetical protein
MDLIDGLCLALLGQALERAARTIDAEQLDTVQLDTGQLDTGQLAARLAEHGWPADRIREHALAVRAADQPWPHPVDAVIVASLGAARFYAALTDLRKQLGVWVLETQAPSPRRELNADERRLLAEVPPHHVG